MEELEKSLKIITEENNNNNIIIVGDFNCPDIQWETPSLKHEASDKEVQRTLIDITSQSGLAQLHEEPTRENNLLDLIFTTNPTLAKISTNIPGISDHAIVVTDIDTKPYYQKTNPRKSYIWAKADWEQVNQDLQGFQSGPVPGTFTRLRSCIVPAEITEPPKISGGENHKYDGR